MSYFSHVRHSQKGYHSRAVCSLLSALTYPRWYTGLPVAHLLKGSYHRVYFDTVTRAEVLTYQISDTYSEESTQECTVLMNNFQQRPIRIHRKCTGTHGRAREKRVIMDKGHCERPITHERVIGSDTHCKSGIYKLNAPTLLCCCCCCYLFCAVAATADIV